MTACRFPQRPSPAVDSKRTERRLHLIDIENLAGCPLPDAGLVRECRRRYIEITRPGGSDLVVVACSPRAAGKVMFEWPGAQRIIREGADGADLALLGAWEDLASTGAGFSGAFIASGDDIFAPLAARMAGAGIEVTVVSRADSLSCGLRIAARHVLCFDPVETGPAEVIPKWKTTQPRQAPIKAMAGLGGGIS